MSYTVTLTETNRPINNRVDNLQIILTVTNSGAGSNLSYSFAEKNLVIKDRGYLEWEYDLENTLIIPGTARISIHDGDGYLKTLLFDTANTDPRFKLEIKLNSVTEFIGHVPEDGLEYDVATNVLMFDAMPNLNNLINTAIYGEDDQVLDPLDYTYGATVNISNATHDAGVVTVTHVSDSTFNVGETVHIESVVGMTDLNGYHIISAENSNTEFEIELYTLQTYTSGGTATLINLSGLYKNIVTMIEDLYQLVDASISYAGGTLDIYHNWSFNHGNGAGATTVKNITNAVYAAGIVTITHASALGLYSVGNTVIIENVVGMTDLNNEFTDLTVPDSTHITVSLITTQTYTSGGTIKRMGYCDFEDLEQLSAPLFYDNDQSLESCADVLKKLAIDWFCYTGMIHEEKAFFRKLFHYDSSNTQTLLTVYDRKILLKYPIIEFVMTRTNISVTHKWVAGSYTTIENKKLIRDTILPGFWVDYDAAVYLSGTNIQYTGSIWVISAKDSDVEDNYNSYYPNGYLLAQLWYNNRNDIQKCRIERFYVEGIHYDYLKCFTYEGYKYQIFRLKKIWKENLSEIDAINLGAA